MTAGWVGVLTLLIISFPMPAQSNPTVGGVGLMSCGSWTAHRSLNAQQWVLGFLSGVGLAGQADAIDPLSGTDAEAVWAWIDNYCRSNPLKQIADAAVAFIVAHPRAAQ
jgi:hypothetical protein